MGANFIDLVFLVVVDFGFVAGSEARCVGSRSGGGRSSGGRSSGGMEVFDQSVVRPERGQARWGPGSDRPDLIGGAGSPGGGWSWRR